MKNDKKIIKFILNIPWTILGLVVVGMLSVPKNIVIDKNNGVIILIVWRLWLNEIFLRRRINGFTLGNIVLLTERFSDFIYNHELVHICQFRKIPLIFPFLYCIEFIKNGYHKNKYEIEAYQVN